MKICTYVADFGRLCHLASVTKGEIEQIFDPKTFAPCVVATKDGFALAVTGARNVLVGIRMIAVKLNGQIYQIPFHAIAHISENGQQIG